MSRRPSRVAVAREAARMMLHEGIKEYYTAKHMAAERLSGGRVERVPLPSNRQIRAEIVAMTSVDRQPRARHLDALRTTAIRMMEELFDFEPRLIGSVASGAVHAQSDIDLHVFCIDHARLEATLHLGGHDYERVDRPVLKDGRFRTFVHYRFRVDGHPVELSVYEPAELFRVSYSSIDGKPIDRVPVNRVRALLASTLELQHADPTDVPTR